MEEPVRQMVQVPEREANELAKRLRHTKTLSGVGLSVYAYVSETGIRALHVAADNPDENAPADKQRYDIRYKADTEIEKLERNAIKRIRAQFEI